MANVIKTQHNHTKTISPSVPAAPIPSCPGYFATVEGEIWSGKTGKFIHQSADRDGYRFVSITLNTKEGHKQATKMVGRLVLEAFQGHMSARTHQANHRNGVRNDNRLLNLEWVTRSANVKHSYEQLGRKPHKSIGSKNPMARLNEHNARKIKQDIMKGLKYKEIAQKFNVSPMTICNIALGRCWSHVKMDK